MAQYHQFNFFDVFLLSVVCVSAIIGFARGFVREVLGFCSWGGAAYLMFQKFEAPMQILGQFISNQVMLRVASQAAVFLVALICFLVISQLISSFVQNSVVHGIDRSIGLIFGLFRAAFFICAFYLALLVLVPNKELPSIVEASKSISLVQRGAIFLQSLLPDSFREHFDFDKKVKYIMDKWKSAQDLTDALSDPKASCDDKSPGGGSSSDNENPDNRDEKKIEDK
ncbi:CvpA family protein [Candidatus Hydrogenosomobacter endosymbioticus]|uniref:Colicin V biosynthesis protein n=1 Tax=Candidatus Hydrogenosomobacter endosymbioticus TaxID=2558174 RepID=A0ABM7V9S4_9PROT|nr:CvpA family protein [Candidatus Hydrogenosomobacter endosymbioticus]BDB96520.1 colicin V biosynthesis protein [Candidatus Hydrogenosomobacter endosymbioticus]